MKLLLIFTIVFSFSVISYSQSNIAFETPRIIYQNSKPRHKQLKVEILKSLINPLLEETKQPIKEIIIDLCPEFRDGSNRRVRGCQQKVEGSFTIAVTVNGFETKNTDGFSLYILIPINKSSGFDKNEYLRLLPEKRL